MMNAKATMEGQRVPEVNIRTRRGHEWVERSTQSIFEGRTVVVFSLPGAFTPTCSSAHVPRYEQLAPEFSRLGVDEIVCVSVNDAFVMEAWREAQGAGNISFLPDGNGEFSAAMGMLVDRSALGFGKRSWRYSMLVRDALIEKMFVEPEKPGDPYEVSDADTMLAYLAPAGPKPLDVVLFGRRSCAHCARARAALERAGIAYEALELNRDYSDRALRAVSGAGSTPQVFVGGRRIGGADEVEAWLAARTSSDPDSHQSMS